MSALLYLLLISTSVSLWPVALCKSERCGAFTTDDDTVVKCYFGRSSDLNTSNFNVLFFYPNQSAAPERVLACNRLDSGKLKCDKARDVTFDEDQIMGDRFFLRRPPSKKFEGGQYQCQLVPHKGEDAQFCTLVYTVLPKRTTTPPGETGDHSTLYIILVAFVVLVVAVVVLVVAVVVLVVAVVVLVVKLKWKRLRKLWKKPDIEASSAPEDQQTASEGPDPSGRSRHWHFSHAAHSDLPQHGHAQARPVLTPAPAVLGNLSRKVVMRPPVGGDTALLPFSPGVVSDTATTGDSDGNEADQVDEIFEEISAPMDRHQAPRHRAPRHQAPRHQAPRHQADRHQAGRHQPFSLGVVSDTATTGDSDGSDVDKADECLEESFTSGVMSDTPATRVGDGSEADQEDDVLEAVKQQPLAPDLGKKEQQEDVVDKSDPSTPLLNVKQQPLAPDRGKEEQQEDVVDKSDPSIPLLNEESVDVNDKNSWNLETMSLSKQVICANQDYGYPPNEEPPRGSARSNKRRPPSILQGQEKPHENETETKEAFEERQKEDMKRFQEKQRNKMKRLEEHQEKEREKEKMDLEAQQKKEMKVFEAQQTAEKKAWQEH